MTDFANDLIPKTATRRTPALYEAAPTFIAPIRESLVKAVTISAAQIIDDFDRCCGPGWHVLG